MASTSSTTGQSVPRAGLRATLRYRWKADGEPIMPRDSFARSVLLGALKLKIGDIFCLQTNGQERSYDVTFDTHATCQRVLEESQRLAGVSPMSLFQLINLDRPNFRLITVHMYNPYVPDQAVAGFLGRYAEILTFPRMVKDSLGIWTGKRQFQALLKPDPAGVEGWAHPPAFFNIGADRGFLFYSRQPPFCRRCRGHGHSDHDCGTVRCRTCQAQGHEAKDCTSPKCCHVCGSADHLAKACQQDKGYAGVVAKGMAGDKRAGQGRQAAQEDPHHGASGVAPLRPLEDVIGEIMAGRQVDEVAPDIPQAPAPAPAPAPQQEQEEEAMEEAEGDLEQLQEEVPANGGDGVVGKKKKKKRRGATQGHEVHGEVGVMGEGEGSTKRVKGLGQVIEGKGLGEDGQEGPGNSSTEDCVPVGRVESEGSSFLGVSDLTGLAEWSAEEGVSVGPILSPLGLDGYEGPLRPSPIPNEVPFSWAERSGSDGDLYD